MIVLKLDGLLVWLTRSELTHCLQNFTKITSRLHDVCETKKNTVYANASFVYSCIHSFRVYLTTLAVVKHMRFKMRCIFT